VQDKLTSLQQKLLHQLNQLPHLKVFLQQQRHPHRRRFRRLSRRMSLRKKIPLQIRLIQILKMTRQRNPRLTRSLHRHRRWRCSGRHKLLNVVLRLVKLPSQPGVRMTYEVLFAVSWDTSILAKRVYWTRCVGALLYDLTFLTFAS
jgi:hypothetical protein